MASPTASDLLSTSAHEPYGRVHAERGPVHRRPCLPNVGVDHKSDSFYVYSRESWNRPQAKPRARATESAGGGGEVETASYNAERFAFHKDIDDQDGPIRTPSSTSIARPRSSRHTSSC